MSDTLMLGAILASLRLATPLAYAALGGYFSERAGVINIGLEGMMLIGAFASAAVAHGSHNPLLGLAAGVAAAMLLAALHALLSIVLGADQIISGIAVNLLALGVPPVVCKVLYGMTGGTPSLEIRDRIPVLFGASPLVWGIFAAALALMFVHRRARFGQYVRFAGEHPKALESQGISARRVRWMAVLLSGALCGIAGAYLAIDHGGGFSRGMTAGRGFIALAALIVGRWTPGGAFLAALVFGAIETSQILLQGIHFPGGQAVPVQWIQMIPYLATLVILAGFFGSRLGRSRPPRALGMPLASIAALVICGSLLSGCQLRDMLIEKLKPKEQAKKNAATARNPGEPAEPQPMERRQVNAEYLREAFRVVLGREVTQEEFVRLLNVLDQGAHYEGLYNGLVYSQEYRDKEKGRAPAGAMKIYSVVMAELVLAQKYDPIKIAAGSEDEPKPDVPKPANDAPPAAAPQPTHAERTALEGQYELEALELPPYTLKRKLGEELLRTIDLKKGYREKLATWYGRFTVFLNLKGVDYGLAQRNNKSEYYHYKWALEAGEDRLKWECLNRLHALVNSTMKSI